ncbi:Methyl-accepting chemotaxis sensor/transducer protein [Pectobacterium sp. F1-1]|uniref:methyl-accepting chemotaxis protein n=1 Tax=Pectobacterium sp. F1-1 TaxID=2949614 RepID=UPI0021D7BE2D|nr:methyl-accepting chemotaxis protein [Pectobacterium sp. F1-1]UYA62448.1 Methyl-accepting chemotaxis sensor/transducer protein [Pectobacterium sp. F1-1]
MSIVNWRIGYRLGIGFSGLIILLFLVGTLSVTRLSDFNQSAKLIVTDTYSDTVDANRLRHAIDETVLGYDRLLLAEDEQQLRNALNSIEKIRQQGRTILKAIIQDSAESDDPTLQKIMSDMAPTRNDFIASGDALIAAITAGNREAAKAEFANRLDRAQTLFIEQIQRYVDYKDNAMMKTLDVMDEDFQHSRLFLLTLIGIGAISGAIAAWVITRSVTQPIQQALTIANRVAEGDLTSQIVSNRQDETGQLLAALSHMNTSLCHIVSQVRDGSEAISTAASQIAAGNQDLSARTEEQASSLEQTASSMEELTSTIKNTADNTRQAMAVSRQSSEAAETSSVVMTSVTQKMRGIRDSSQRMAEIISVIDSIAFQTNILALNAAVEAARAGEQGRGFAVVASEVRSLAQRSATAAKEIKELIDDSVNKVQEGMMLVDSAEATMNTLTSHVSDVNAIIAEISQASQEQSDGISQINIAVGQIDTTTQQNAALVEESAAAAVSLQSQANVLTQTVSAFKLAQSGTPARLSIVPELALGTAGSPNSSTLKTPKSDTQDWTSF